MRLESHHVMFILAMAVIGLIMVADFYTLQRKAIKYAPMTMATPSEINQAARGK